MTTDPALTGTHEDDDAPIESGPGVRWGGDGSLARSRAPRWGSGDAVLAGLEVTPAGIHIPPPAPPGPLARRVATIDGMAFASPIRRVASFFVDTGLKIVIMMFGVLAAGVEFREGFTLPLEIGLAAIALNVAYAFVFGISGVSPGGRLLKIRIIRYDGDAPGIRRSFVRAVFSFNEPVLYVSSIWILFDARRQALHDKAAGTLVVHGLVVDDRSIR